MIENRALITVFFFGNSLPVANKVLFERESKKDDFRNIHSIVENSIEAFSFDFNIKKMEINECVAKFSEDTIREYIVMVSFYPVNSDCPVCGGIGRHCKG